MRASHSFEGGGEPLWIVCGRAFQAVSLQSKLELWGQCCVYPQRDFSLGVYWIRRIVAAWIITEVSSRGWTRLRWYDGGVVLERNVAQAGVSLLQKTPLRTPPSRRSYSRCCCTPRSSCPSRITPPPTRTVNFILSLPPLTLLSSNVSSFRWFSLNVKFSYASCSFSSICASSISVSTRRERRSFATP